MRKNKNARYAHYSSFSKILLTMYRKRTHSIESNHVLIKIPLKKEKTLYLQLTLGYETFLQEF